MSLSIMNHAVFFLIIVFIYYFFNFYFVANTNEFSLYCSTITLPHVVILC